jgi:hypothetical protein
VLDRGGEGRTAYRVDDQIETALESVDDGVGTEQPQLLAALLEVAHERGDSGSGGALCEVKHLAAIE